MIPRTTHKMQWSSWKIEIDPWIWRRGGFPRVSRGGSRRIRGGEVFRGVWMNVGGLGVSSTADPKCLFIGQWLRAVAPLVGRCYRLPPVTTGGATASWAMPPPVTRDNWRCYRQLGGAIACRQWALLTLVCVAVIGDSNFARFLLLWSTQPYLHRHVKFTS